VCGLGVWVWVWGGEREREGGEVAAWDWVGERGEVRWREGIGQGEVAGGVGRLGLGRLGILGGPF
jgi:hypothetical protein